MDTIRGVAKIFKDSWGWVGRVEDKGSVGRVEDKGCCGGEGLKTRGVAGAKG
jgi:hypothetical protein